ncbi:MAG: TonB-dependent receptor [Bacteroidales bacterium]|nr:TonB-dependent receptor [Bacteroidales bacterium]
MYRRRLLIFYFFILLCCSIKSYSQDLNSIIISDISSTVSLEDYLDGVSEQTSIQFFYNRGIFSGIYVNIEDNGKLLADFLEAKLAEKEIVYFTYRSRNVIFVERSQMSLTEQNGVGDKNGTIGITDIIDIGDPRYAGKYKRVVLEGIIQDGKTGDPLPGAVLYVEDQDVGVLSDLNGKYHIELSVGKHTLRFSYVGFQDKQQNIRIISPGSLNVELFEESMTLEEVVVMANSNANIKSPELSIIRLDAKTLDNIPLLLGEPDLMKTMTLLPGVQSSGDMASGFNVRGGSLDQNLILIDDVPIYNSTHLFGLFSILDTRSINGIELYKGGAPARFGGRASSVMNITLKDGDMEEVKCNGGIGIFSSKLTLQGPVVNDKASFIIGGRTTYSDWILRHVPDADIRNSKANFYDLNAKLNYSLNENNRISLFAYVSRDIFNLAEKNEYLYKNLLGSVKWNHIFSDKLTSGLTFYLSNYITEASDKEKVSDGYTILSGIMQAGTKYHFLFNINDINSLDLGIESNIYKFRRGERKPFSSGSRIPYKLLEDEHAFEIAGYLQDKVELGSRISGFLGLRFANYFLVGPGTINTYAEGTFIDEFSFIGTQEYDDFQPITSYFGLEPRFGIRYAISAYNSLKLGYSRNYQFLHIISNTSVVTPTDIWKSSDPYIQPALGDQIVIGFFKNSIDGVLETSVEAYYKTINHMVEYKNNAQLIMNENIEQELLSSKLTSYGIELLFRKNAGRASGWISYTISHASMVSSGATVEDLVNDGGEYPSYFDKPHDVSIVFNYAITKRLNFGTVFTYSTGRPVTLPESRVNIKGNEVVYYSDRNEYRLKDYHRLDVSLVWNTSIKKNKKYHSSWSFSVYNLYGRNNIYSTFYKKEIPGPLNDYKTYSLYELSIIGIPIPSISYNFNF